MVTHDTDNHLREKIDVAMPARLAILMSSDPSVGIAHQKSDFDAIWRHQLSSPLFSVEIDTPASVLGGEVSKGSAGGGLKTFGDLLTHPHPPLEFLKKVKDFGKRHLLEPETLIPLDVARALYYLPIALAFLKHKIIISSLSNPDLRLGLSWLAAQCWLDSHSRAAAEEAREALEAV